MSDVEDEKTVLGKRNRNGDAAEDEKPAMQENRGADEESDDDDVGPMPMPADASAGGPKKKRKGMCLL